jgi:hypothetical protein
VEGANRHLFAKLSKDLITPEEAKAAFTVGLKRDRDDAASSRIKKRQRQLAKLPIDATCCCL